MIITIKYFLYKGGCLGNGLTIADVWVVPYLIFNFLCTINCVQKGMINI